MKRGEPAVYTFLDTVRPHGQQGATGKVIRLTKIVEILKNFNPKFLFIKIQ